ncbi:hypothetical protein AB0I51_46075 [Streptomyces sp. NPDC050549]|uniref:hypothetical protein n=1 Tax=Streptomyces sp. NPDC050549 TaxID=3155406 RepID=UPI00341DA256
MDRSSPDGWSSTAKLLAEKVGLGRQPICQELRRPVTPTAPNPWEGWKSLIVTVISGEACLLLETGETIMRQGDIVVQRGTEHAWRNRTGMACVVSDVIRFPDAIV